ncbi:hypothetical protein HWV62_1056 [Athelia sp. TMB]|nr:hypothetical protein HWV62_1056 [Athelia sp. TMB]
MAQNPFLKWTITRLNNPKGHPLWFSDGESVTDCPRGAVNLSSRLIVGGQGFLDITVYSGGQHWIALNGEECQVIAASAIELNLSLTLPGNSRCFIVVMKGPGLQAKTIRGSIKPFPPISYEDICYFRSMISERYVPYPKHPSDPPGKDDSQIRTLGKQLFPWSIYSYELAMIVYDWTTPSFVRMVLPMVFQYTDLPQNPFPLDEDSIALMIWRSNWEEYQPSDPDYMRSFFMEPADSLEDVATQLPKISSRLQQSAIVANRLLHAAAYALPRTPVLAKPYLYSGQVDIQDMGTSRFGACFYEFSGNAGPIGQPLEVQLPAALDSFLRPGSIITTKMTWSFTDTIEDAMSHSNGILLIAEPQIGCVVWEEGAYVTDLSVESTKTEYIFTPESRFRVQAHEEWDLGAEGKQIQVIRLMTLPRRVVGHVCAEVGPEEEAAAPSHDGAMSTRVLHDQPLGINLEKPFGDGSALIATDVDALERGGCRLAWHAHGRVGAQGMQWPLLLLLVSSALALALVLLIFRSY